MPDRRHGTEGGRTVSTFKLADRAAATLAEIRAIEQAATKGPWQAVRGTWGENETFPAVVSRDGDPARSETWLMAAGRGSPDPEANAEFTAAAKTAMPLLLAALEAVLKLADDSTVMTYGHAPGRQGPIAWTLDPAELRAAITSALTGEETTDG